MIVLSWDLSKGRLKVAIEAPYNWLPRYRMTLHLSLSVVDGEVVMPASVGRMLGRHRADSLRMSLNSRLKISALSS